MYNAINMLLVMVMGCEKVLAWVFMKIDIFCAWVNFVSEHLGFLLRM